MRITKTGFMLVLALGILLGALGARWLAGRVAVQSSGQPALIVPKPASAEPTTLVQTALVRQVSMPRGVAAVGSLRSRDSVVLRSELAGRIVEINFTEGGKVTQGQVLVRLDDSVSKAQLQQAQANLGLVASQYRRADQLAKQGFISKQGRDEVVSQFKVQEAAVALARAQLDKTVIRAPFDGLIGLRNVSVGDYVSPGADLAPIESIDALNVDFRIPEQFLGDVRVGIRLVLHFDALAGQVRDGQVAAISPLVDAGGRSILLRASVPNADGALRPGMFARVQLQFADNQATVVPETALAPSGDAQYVFRLEDGRARRVVVTVGQRHNGEVEILDGLLVGEQVVVSGLQKVRDGAAVKVLTPASSS